MKKTALDNILKVSINKLKSEGRYRYFNEIERKVGKHPYALWKPNQQNVIVWCSNDYLGMSQNKLVIDSMINSAKQNGVGSGGTRNISGNSSAIVNLEHELTELHGKEKTIVFSSGYVANESTLGTLLRLLEDPVVFSDERNHASIISGIRNSMIKKEIFKHNNINDLEELIKKYPEKKNKIIVFESIYSMDGDFGDIHGIINIAEKYNCITYLDEVHAVGIYGNNGAGLASELGLNHSIDIIQGTLGKAFGVIGGYISSSNTICDAIRSYANGYIFTTSLPPALAQSAITSITYLKNSNKERLLQKKNTNLLKKYLSNENINFIDNKSHIVPIMINDPVKCKNISNMLMKDFRHYIQPIYYPSVPIGTERLRITAGPFHNENMIRDLCISLKNVLNRF